MSWRLLTTGLLLCAVLAACAPAQGQAGTVVVYTSVDQPYSEPVLARFEAETGIQVKAVYDVEAAKTTGLANRLVAEKDHPQADVFWNSEIIQTLVLKEKGVLAPFSSPELAHIPDTLRDPDGYWAGFAARARVILVNSERVPQAEGIDSLDDFTNPAWPGAEAGIAYPLFGTTATHAAALYALHGPQAARAWFQELAVRQVRVAGGNSVVRDLVVQGDLSFGLTDSDDACAALAAGAAVSIVLPDQQGQGTLVIPNTVALVAGAPHPGPAQQLIDYLLSAAVEEALVEAGFTHIPVHPGLQSTVVCLPVGAVKALPVDWEQVYLYFGQVQDELKDVFLRG